MEASPDVLQEHNEVQEGLTVEKATKLLFLSYKFSQGSGATQDLLFYWLHKKHPDWRMDDEMRNSVQQQSTEYIEKFMQVPENDPHGNSKTFLHGQTDSKAIETALTEELNSLEKILRGGEGDFFTLLKNTPEYIVKEITTNIVKLDDQYMNRKEGRPQRGGAPKLTPATDPFLSHLCYYALAGHSTGSPEYDELFGKVKEYVDKQIEAGTGSIFLNVIDVYNEKHPDAPVYADRITT